ncbi:MAG: hypothetical protein ACI8ZF_001041 [Candidatus Midichloriaceae bacterium]|jgi:hypothetical protein
MKKIYTLLFCFLLASCKSTVQVHNPVDYKKIAEYNNVVIGVFKDGSNKKQKSDSDDFDNISGKFKRSLEQKIMATKNFHSVIIGESDKKALKITGTVTEYEKGNAVARMMIGFGAGRSSFKANIFLSDNITNEQLGEIKVSNCAWPLGGVIAASQDLDNLVNSSTTSVVKKLK